MAFGILQPSSGEVPAGTAMLEMTSSGRRTDAVEIVLVPTPTSSPQDPLNWSRYRKEMFFFTIILGACATGVIGPVLVPCLSLLATTLDVSLQDMVLTNGILVMALGVSSYVCSCISTVCGKRWIFLVTTVCLIAFSCWAAAAKSYWSLFVARLFQGLAMGGWFALAGTGLINDVFFVHQRGFRVGLWNFAVIVSVNITPVVSAPLIVNLSWRWAYWILAILFGVVLAMALFFLPESSFNRSALDIEGVAIEIPFDEPNEGKKELLPLEKTRNSNSTSLEMPIRDERGRSLEVLLSVVKPLTLMTNPTTWWACIMWSITFTWVIIQGAVADQIFTAPPWNLSPIATGNLVGIAPLVGSAIGTVFGGWLCDWFGTYFSVRNNGTFEPEFRLWVMIPFVITAVVGCFGLGIVVERGMSTVACGAFLAIVNLSVGIGCTGIVSYCNDCFRERAAEVFGIAMLVKSAFAFGLTFMLNDYLAAQGPQTFFFTWAGLTVGCSLFTLPLYVFGKRIRSSCLS